MISWRAWGWLDVRLELPPLSRSAGLGRQRGGWTCTGTIGAVVLGAGLAIGLVDHRHTVSDRLCRRFETWVLIVGDGDDRMGRRCG